VTIGISFDRAIVDDDCNPALAPMGVRGDVLYAIDSFRLDSESPNQNGTTVRWP
jgi:hypothetical protein